MNHRCDQLGVCQNLPNRCRGCTPATVQFLDDTDANADQVADVWDRIWFYGVITVTTTCTVLTLAVAGLTMTRTPAECWTR